MATLMRVSILGTLPGGEVWSVNPVYRLGTGGDVPTTALQCQQIVTAINSRVVPTGITGAMTTSTFVTGCRVEARVVNGTLEALAEGARSTPTGGTTSSGHPYQTSLVASLRTTHPGPSGRGRLYWPAVGIPILATTLRVNSTSVGTLLIGVKTFLSGIETDIEATMGGAALGVWSRKEAAVHAVTSIQIGDVADVQRRRRDQLVEAVQASSYP